MLRLMKCLIGRKNFYLVDGSKQYLQGRLGMMRGGALMMSSIISNDVDVSYDVLCSTDECDAHRSSEAIKSIATYGRTGE